MDYKTSFIIRGQIRALFSTFVCKLIFIHDKLHVTNLTSSNHVSLENVSEDVERRKRFLPHAHPDRKFQQLG